MMPFNFYFFNEEKQKGRFSNNAVNFHGSFEKTESWFLQHVDQFELQCHINSEDQIIRSLSQGGMFLFSFLSQTKNQHKH